MKELPDFDPNKKWFQEYQEVSKRHRDLKRFVAEEGPDHGIDHLCFLIRSKEEECYEWRRLAQVRAELIDLYHRQVAPSASLKLRLEFAEEAVE